MVTLDPTHYSAEPDCVTIYNATRGNSSFSEQVKMSKISNLMFSQRYVFGPGFLYNNENRDDLLKKGGRDVLWDNGLYLVTCILNKC